MLPLLVSLAAHADADYIIITGNEFVPGSMITDVGVAHRIPVVFLWATLDRYERDLFAKRNVERYIYRRKRIFRKNGKIICGLIYLKDIFKGIYNVIVNVYNCWDTIVYF